MVVGFSAADLASRLGGELVGDGELLLTGVADLREAGPTELAFVANPRYRRHLAESRAGAVLVDPQTELVGRTHIRLPDPYAAFAKALALFHPPFWPDPGVDERASVHPTAQLGAGVRVEPFAVVGAGARIGEGSWIQSGAYVGAESVLGPRCRLMPGAVVMERCTLGARVWLNPGAVVGAEGFGFAPTRTGLLKIPQPGPVEIGDDVELGANSCVDRPALGATRVGAGTKTDNLVQVGHAAQVGEHNTLVAFACIAGSAKLGAGVTVALRSTVLGHLDIGDFTTIAAHSMVTRDSEPKATLAGVPARDHPRWLKVTAAAQGLPELGDELRALRERVNELERRLAALGEEEP